MKDIDFDELDRAVNSVLSTSSPKTDESSAISNSSHEPAVSTSTTDPQPPSPAPQKDLVQKRRTGRFMDVVPQSSRTKNATPRPIVSRQAPSIAPLETSSNKEDALDHTNRDHSLNDELDTTRGPLEFGESSRDTLLEERHEAKAALDQAAGELAGLNGIMGDDTEEAPLSTPFMNDLSVEKRPLGAFSLDETDGSLLSQDARTYQSHLDDKGSHDTSNDGAVEIDTHMNDALMRELNGEAEVGSSVQVETEEETSPAVEDKPTLAATGEDELPAELQDEMNAIASKPVDVRESHNEPAPEKEKEPAVSSPLRGGSIPTQYKTAPKTQSEEITPVFDTDSYHQPLHHGKKKSGWLSVVIITTLVLVGVGLGALIYFLDPFGLL